MKKFADYLSEAESAQGPVVSTDQFRARCEALLKKEREVWATYTQLVRDEFIEYRRKSEGEMTIRFNEELIDRPATISGAASAAKDFDYMIKYYWQRREIRGKDPLYGTWFPKKGGDDDVRINDDGKAEFGSLEPSKLEFPPESKPKAPSAASRMSMSRSGEEGKRRTLADMLRSTKPKGTERNFKWN